MNLITLCTTSIGYAKIACGADTCKQKEKPADEPFETLQPTVISEAYRIILQ